MLINLYPQAEEFLATQLHNRTADNDVHGDAFRINYTATVREDNALLEKTRFAPLCNILAKK